MSRRRFFVSRFHHGRAVLEGQSAYHLARVLRAQPGQLYELSDQREVWLGRVATVESSRVEFDLLERVTVQELGQLVLLAAIVKFSRFEWVLEKATELGVSGIVAVAAERSATRLVAGAGKRSARWKKVLQAAAQQARRPAVPWLQGPVSFVDALMGVDSDVRILLSEDPTSPLFRQLLAAHSPVRNASLVVGPEGGWTERERQAALKQGFVAASLGPTTLRSETAALAALAVLAHELAVAARDE